MGIEIKLSSSEIVCVLQSLFRKGAKKYVISITYTATRHAVVVFHLTRSRFLFLDLSKIYVDFTWEMGRLIAFYVQAMQLR